MESEDLRIAVYNRFRRGQIPTVVVLANDLAVTPEDVRRGLQGLAVRRHLALGADGEIAMAHPFTAVPLGFSVMGKGTLWWGGCAWDSFALPHMLPEQSPTLVATACPACDTPHAWHVDNREAPSGEHQRGYVMDLQTLWRLASGWYAGRLERGYVRREPSAAADCLRSVGLRGAFWGLPV